MDSNSVNQDNAKKQGIFYGWIIVAVAFFITAITCGAFYSYGVFFIPLLTEFGWTRGLTSGAASISGLTYAASIPVAGLLADRYGFRLTMAITAGLLGLGFILSSQIQTVWQLYLFAGFLTGCGASIAVALPLSMVAQWFTKRQGLALGIASAGISFGTAVVPPLVSYLVYDYGWRATYVIVGIMVCLVCIPASLIAVRKPEINYIQAYEGKEATKVDRPKPTCEDGNFSFVEAVATVPFWSLFGIYALCIISIGISLIHVVPYALDTGLSAGIAAGLLTTIGICSFVGRLVSGVTSDRLGTKTVLAACLTIQGISMLWLIKANEPWMLYLFAAFFGISYGGCMPLVPKTTSQFFGSRSIGAIFGGISVADGIGFAVGPLFAGYVFDLTGSYHLSFLSAAAGVFGAVILTLFLRTPKKVHGHKP